MRTVIIGASFSGLTCAYYLKKNNPLNEVIIIEQNSELGKKVKATGNGKCNFTNNLLFNNINKNNYDIYNHQDFVLNLIKKFDNNCTIKMFNELGLISKEISEGRVYPYNEQAISVNKAFELMIKKYNIKLLLNSKVIKINKHNNKYNITYQIDTNNNYQNIDTDYVVAASGGIASPDLGSDGSMFKVLDVFNLNKIPFLPGLSGIIVNDKSFSMLDGIRTKAFVKVFYDSKLIYCDNGEIQFKKEGISGIVIMNAESVAARFHQDFTKFNFIVDFLYEYSKDELKDLINDNLDNLELIVPLKLSNYLKKITNNNKELIINKLKEYNFNIKGPYGFDRCQITIGGIDINEVDKDTLEVKKHKKMYLIGEVLDIDGLCGGYNIQWAITSGYIAAQSITQTITQSITHTINGDNHE